MVCLLSQRLVSLLCHLQVSLPCPLEASPLSLELFWLLLSSQPVSLRLSFRRLVSVPWQLALQASPLRSSSLRLSGLLEASGSSSTREQYLQIYHPDKSRPC